MPVPADRDEGLQNIARAQREIEILCDHFGMDPTEFLAEQPDETTVRPFDPGENIDYKSEGALTCPVCGKRSCDCGPGETGVVE